MNEYWDVEHDTTTDVDPVVPKWNIAAVCLWIAAAVSAALLIIAMGGCCRRCAADPTLPRPQDVMVTEPGEPVLKEVYGEKLPDPADHVASVPICQGSYRPNLIERKTAAHYSTSPEAREAERTPTPEPASNDTEITEDPRYVGTKLAGKYFIHCSKTH